MATTKTAQANCRYPGCHRLLTAPGSVRDAFGPRCKAKLRATAAVMETALAGLSEAQRTKALGLIRSGSVVLTSRPGTYRVPSSDGITTYLVNTAGCPCPARRLCYHVGAVRCLEAVTAASRKRAA